MRAAVDRILRPFALVVTDRRWAAPLCAAALGFGLFVGVAIGPNAAGTLAGATQILEMPAPSDGGAEDTAPSQAPSRGLGGSALGGSGGGLAEAPLPPAPLAPSAPLSPAPPAEEEPAPEPTPRPTEPTEEEEGEEETELKGVVVQANPAAGSYALAIADGELVPVHGRELPPPGARLTVTARRLANGTFTETKTPERKGKTAQAIFRGVVTYAKADPLAPAYTVSGRGASLLVSVPPDPAGTVPELPVLGSRVIVTAAIGDRLDQRAIEVEEGEPSTYLDLAGVVQAVLPETAQLVLSADGVDGSEADLALTVPPAIALGKVELGDSYLATAEVQPDGSLALAGLASDEHVKGADDDAFTQGDLEVD